MDLELIIALFGFAFATVITPGPNNLMLMASGANFGLKRTLPHMLGIILGFPFMVLLVGVGVLQVFDAWPPSYTILKVLSVLYMLWLAWKIATAVPPEAQDVTGKPLSFVQSAAFQWVNPKAWSMALGAITLFATNRDWPSVLLVAFAYVLCGVVSTSSWTILGQTARRFLERPSVLRKFNIAMAALLLATLIPVLLEGFS